MYPSKDYVKRSGAEFWPDYCHLYQPPRARRKHLGYYTRKDPCPVYYHHYYPSLPEHWYNGKPKAKKSYGILRSGPRRSHLGLGAPSSTVEETEDEPYQRRKLRPRLGESSTSEEKSVRSSYSGLSVDVSCEMAAVNRDIEEILTKYESAFDASIMAEVQPKDLKFEAQSKDRRKSPTTLTEEQKRLVAMDRPPLDKLKHIPLSYLKPRPPAHLKRKKSQVKPSGDAMVMYMLQDLADRGIFENLDEPSKSRINEIVNSIVPSKSRQNAATNTTSEVKSSETQTLDEFDSGIFKLVNINDVSDTVNFRSTRIAKVRNIKLDDPLLKKDSGVNTEVLDEDIFKDLDDAMDEEIRETKNAIDRMCKSEGDLTANKSLKSFTSVVTGTSEMTQETNFSRDSSTMTAMTMEKRESLQESSGNIPLQRTSGYIHVPDVGSDPTPLRIGEIHSLGNRSDQTGGGDSPSSILIQTNAKVMHLIDSLDFEKPERKNVTLDELDRVISENCDHLDSSVSVSIIRKLISAMMKSQPVIEPRAGLEPYVRPFIKLRRDHLKHILREVNHIERLDVYLEGFDIRLSTKKHEVVTAEAFQ